MKEWMNELISFKQIKVNVFKNRLRASARLPQRWCPVLTRNDKAGTHSANKEIHLEDAEVKSSPSIRSFHN